MHTEAVEPLVGRTDAGEQLGPRLVRRAVQQIEDRSSGQLLGRQADVVGETVADPHDPLVDSADHERQTHDRRTPGKGWLTATLGEITLLLTAEDTLSLSGQSIKIVRQTKRLLPVAGQCLGSVVSNSVSVSVSSLQRRERTVVTKFAPVSSAGHERHRIIALHVARLRALTGVPVGRIVEFRAPSPVPYIVQAGARPRRRGATVAGYCNGDYGLPASR
jgi:hypothetical protein